MEIQRVQYRRVIILSIVLFLGWAATPSWAGVQCGDTIGPGAVAFLTEDLTCGGFQSALTLESGSILNLGGHTLDCDGSTGVGIEMRGGGSILQYGVVTNCFDSAVRIRGTGSHIIRKVTATQNGIGFYVFPDSENNELQYNVAKNNTLIGFLSQGDGTILKENLAKDNLNLGFDVERTKNNALIKNRSIGTTGTHGFEIDGEGHELRENVAKDNKLDGFTFFPIFGSQPGQDITLNGNKSIGNGRHGFRLFENSGSGFTLLQNTAKNNQGEGIRVEEDVVNSTFLGNISLKNGGEGLVDLNFVPPCDNNTWVGNFGSRNQDCIH